MKKLISILALAALVVIPLQGAHAVNPPKAGENCPKEGLIQTAGNKKFTCIKLGTKLYWNNGVTVKKTNKSPISDLLKIPATCTVVLPEWSSIPQSVNAGAVSYSTLILNSSVSFSAVNILVFIDWYDRYGKVNSEKISIPRLIPGQSVALGQYSSFSTNGLPKIPEPNEISIRSTCKSERYTRILPTLTGKSAVNLEELEDYGTKIFILKSKILFDNKFSKTLSCELKCNYQVYGVYKDRYDNTFGGFAGDPYGTEEIASGDSGSIEIATEFGFTDYPIPEWLDRITKIDYTIIPKF